MSKTKTQTNDQTPQRVFVATPYERAYAVDRAEVLFRAEIREFNCHSLPLLKKFGLFKSTDLYDYTRVSVQDCINSIIRDEVQRQRLTDPIDIQNYIISRTPVLKAELSDYGPMLSESPKYFACVAYNDQLGIFEYDSAKAETVLGIWAEDEKAIRVYNRLQKACALLNSFAVTPELKLSDIIASPATDLTSIYKIRGIMRRSQWKQFVDMQPDED